MDSWPDVDLVADFDIGNEGLASEGYYYFDNWYDLGGIFTTRLLAQMQILSADIFRKWDSIVDFDEVSDVDGTAYTDTGVELQVRSTSHEPEITDSVWSAWRPFYIGDYTARAFEFRVHLISYKAGITPQVSQLHVELHMQNRTESGNSITSGSGAYNVVFSKPFKATPSNGITGHNLATGDYFTVTNQSETGFTVEFFNSAGSPVSRIFDWQSTGYGIKN